MKFPITKYGLPQVIIFPLAIITIMIVLFLVFTPAPWLIPVEAFLLIILIWLLSFFRDPARKIISDESILYSPADAQITEISLEETEGNRETEILGKKILKISMFLSVFNVHVNRLPCTIKILDIKYKKGKFLNAMSLDASKLNESNDVLMERVSAPNDKIIVRQITGAIARRIVCKLIPGTQYSQGYTYGMMKFGSRSDIYLNPGEGSIENGFSKLEICVKKGDKVRGGLTPIIRYKTPS